MRIVIRVFPAGVFKTARALSTVRFLWTCVLARERPAPPALSIEVGRDLVGPTWG